MPSDDQLLHMWDAFAGDVTVTARPLNDGDKLSFARAVLYAYGNQPSVLATKAPEMPAADSGASRDVLAERQRQISAEGWTPEHDDEHDSHEMAHAAACYAYPELTALVRDHRSNYVRAGALLLAEIERIDRAARQGEGHTGTSDGGKP